MIGTQRTGRLPGIHIGGTAHEGLAITANGQPAQLAIATKDPGNSPMGALFGDIFNFGEGEQWVLLMASPELAACLQR